MSLCYIRRYVVTPGAPLVRFTVASQPVVEQVLELRRLQPMGFTAQTLHHRMAGRSRKSSSPPSPHYHRLPHLKHHVVPIILGGAGYTFAFPFFARSSLCRLPAETHSSSGVEVLAVGRVVLRKFRGDVVEKLAAEALSQGCSSLKIFFLQSPQ